MPPVVPPSTYAPLGLDAFSQVVIANQDRIVMVNGEPCGSPIDVIAKFKDVKNPRQYWKDHKKQLLSKDPDVKNSEPDPELVANLYQLKIPAADGKLYKTDLAPLWVCIYIAATINQPFRKGLAKFTAADIKYRMVNVANGYEWAADGIHEIVKRLPPVSDSELEYWEK